jgi:hypothetical protein
VLGGVAAAELRDAREAAAIAAAAAAVAGAGADGGAGDASAPPPPPLELLLGGTRLLTPTALCELALA